MTSRWDTGIEDIALPEGADADGYRAGFRARLVGKPRDVPEGRDGDPWLLGWDTADKLGVGPALKAPA